MAVKKNQMDVSNLTLSDVLGCVSWLMIQSPLHRRFTIADYDWFVMPALELKQFKIFYQDHVPVGYVSWAFVSEESQEKLKGGVLKMSPDDWSGGDNIWIMDILTPFGSSKKFLQRLSDKEFKNKQVHMLYNDKNAQIQHLLLKDFLEKIDE